MTGKRADKKKDYYLLVTSEHSKIVTNLDLRKQRIYSMFIYLGMVTYEEAVNSSCSILKKYGDKRNLVKIEELAKERLKTYEMYLNTNVTVDRKHHMMYRQCLNCYYNIDHEKGIITDITFVRAPTGQSKTSRLIKQQWNWSPTDRLYGFTVLKFLMKKHFLYTNETDFNRLKNKLLMEN